MGGSESRCAQLLDEVGWKKPHLGEELQNKGLLEYLKSMNLEVIMPQHAPQNDMSIGDKKARMYPRPNFCWEGYKMHIAMLGPSSACKKQFIDFLPGMAQVFQGPPSKLAPGREAVPYYFFDEALHRLVLWELPEFTYKQSAEDYVREVGLLYIDCIFMLFSEKYLLTDIYAKLCVSLALHGVPFFVLCTQSEETDQKVMNKIKSAFQSKDIQVRMFDPAKPQATIEPLLNDFFKEVKYSRSKGPKNDKAEGLSEAVLGQTVRIKGLEKKAELNGRCGVCIGFETDRYIVRLITAGVEIDLALKEANISMLKPKLTGAMVRITGLVSKPELNGLYGFVDEFLRENERYRVFLPLPGKHGEALSLALKSENLERVDSVSGAGIQGGGQRAAPPSIESPTRKSAPSVPAKSAAIPPSAQASAKAKAATPAAKPKAAPEVASKATTQVPARAKPSAVAEDDFAAFLPKIGGAEEGAQEDFMARLFASDPDPEPAVKESKAPAEQHFVPPSRQGPARRLGFSRKGLLGLRVWAVLGDPQETEDVVDHLMDCGRTVLSVNPGGVGAQFASVAELNNDASKPQAELLAVIGPCADLLAAAEDALRIGLKGLLLHPDVSAFAPEAVDLCRKLPGLLLHGVDILKEVKPGDGLAVAPLD